MSHRTPVRYVGETRRASADGVIAMSQSATRLHLVADEPTRTHCPYCAFQCGMTVATETRGKPPFKVQADPDFPVNRGQMCIKGFTSAALLDHANRITSPMIRQAD